jgi:hypothetical protein
VSGADSLTEALWSHAQVATVSVPSASAVTITAGWPTITIPAGFFTKLGDRTSSARLMLQGGLTATATIPTFAFGLAWTQANPGTFSAANLLHAISATNTPGGAVTLAQVKFEWHIGLRTLGLGAASTLVCTGDVDCPSGFATPFKLTMPATNGSKTSASTIDVTQPIYLWPYITLGAATAGNTVTLDWGKLFGDS